MNCNNNLNFDFQEEVTVLKATKGQHFLILHLHHTYFLYRCVIVVYCNNKKYNVTPVMFQRLRKYLLQHILGVVAQNGGGWEKRSQRTANLKK